MNLIYPGAHNRMDGRSDGKHMVLFWNSAIERGRQGVSSHGWTRHVFHKRRATVLGTSGTRGAREPRTEGSIMLLWPGSNHIFKYDQHQPSYVHCNPSDLVFLVNNDSSLPYCPYLMSFGHSSFVLLQECGTLLNAKFSFVVPKPVTSNVILW